MRHSYARLFRALFILSAFLFSSDAQANHLAAANMQVDYIGSGPNDLKYKITLTVYRACESGSSALLLRQPIKIQSPSIGFYKIDTAYAPQLETVYFLCGFMGRGTDDGSCSNSGHPHTGYLKATYTDTVTVPARSADLTFSWKLLARNFGIVNLYTGQDAFISAGINNLVRHDVSTPHHYGAPLMYTCANVATTYVNAPYDITADSLVTIPESTYSDSGRAALYSPAYSFNPPLGGSSYLVDTVTGNASFLLNNTGKYVLTFKTTKYDRHTRQPLAWTTRDVQIVALSCLSGNNPFTDSVVNVAGGTLTNGVIETMVGANLSFDVSVTARFATISLASNHTTAAAGSSFVVSYPSATNVNGHFTWAPAPADTGLRYIYYTYKDTACSVMGIFTNPQVRRVAIHVKGLPVTVRNMGGQQAVTIYPNPANDQLFITGTDKQLPYQVVVFDLMGQKVLEVRHTDGPVDVSRLRPGCYVLKVFRDNILLANATFVKN